MIVKFKKLSPFAKVPTYGTDYAACFDLYSIEDQMVMPNGRKLIKTGLSVEVPQGHALMVYPRSGLALRYGITLGNSVGIIDADYRGEVMVLLNNLGMLGFEVMRGDRIAQGMVMPVAGVSFVEDELSETERGMGGFGSTGK